MASSIEGCDTSTCTDDTKDSTMKTDCHVYKDGEESAEDLKENERLVEASTRYPHRLPGQTIYRGMLLNEVTLPSDLQETRRVELMSDDILICGFPRSGTTWLGEVLYLLNNDLSVTDIEEKMCYSRILWIDDKRSHKILPNFPRPRILKTHLPASLIQTDQCRIILAVRDARDVCVAMYHFYKMNKHFGNFNRDFDEFGTMFMSGYMHWGSWVRHFTSWWQALQHSCDTSNNILPVFYEDMKADPHAAIHRIAQFLKKDVSDNDVNVIVNETSFAKMKARPSTNLEHIKAFSGTFIRKGEVGDWKNHFSQDLKVKFEAWLKSNIQDEDLRKRFNLM